MKEVKIETPQVVQQFANWYNQLPANEQATLYSYLQNWVNKNLPSNRPSQSHIQPHFGGKTYGGPVTNKVVGNSKKHECTNCGTSFESILCNGCGKIIKIE